MLWKHKIAKSIGILILLSSIANILYILGVFPKTTIKIGFAIVMLSSCIINLCGINNKEQRKEYKDSLYGILGICNLFLWLATYIIANLLS